MSNDRNMPNRKPEFFSGKGQGRGPGRGQGRGPGRGRGRGRPPIAYPIRYDVSGRQDSTTLVLSSFELQILQMADVEDLNQNEIAVKLNISQTSVWRYLKSARTKTAKALSENNQIRVEIID